MKVGFVSHLYPTRRLPTVGNFIKDELDNLSTLVEIQLLAPLAIQRWYGEIHKETTTRGYSVVRPIFLSFPHWFLQDLTPSSMACTLKYVGKTFFRSCEIVHAHYAFPDGIATIIAFGKRLPVIITTHGSDINYFAKKHHLKTLVIEKLSMAQRVICVSTSLKNTLQKMGVTSDIEVIPNGVDTSVFSPGDKTLSSQILNLVPDRPRVLFVGNFKPVKGIEYLIRAMPEVVQQYPGCECILLGAEPSGNDAMRYRKTIRDAGVINVMNIVHKVPHADLPHWMRASDVLVLPSISEGFGLVAAEALACGIPVVSTCSGGPEDIVEEGMGVLVPPKNASALAKAIIAVFSGNGIQSPELIAQSAHRRFSYNEVCRRIFNMYNDVVRNYC